MLLKVTDDILRAFDRRKMVFLLLLDLSRTFDTVNHELLCIKLKNGFGFTSSAVSLIRSFSVGFLPMTSWLPQGSVLGPLLFSLFVAFDSALIC